ncbi:hypothetical protein CYLTODRAFT_445725 [Cylindrobasidium torrendii FP15055 ss-10]|uniref:Uncharacterized protein n=1 Tax=Cylindrobasidium torrendii FP15055 ss-10 TaxID=1314674 RepID=A0A0D7B2P5_9AGAR|nr:hypothetical protein CYLTODRAFT_445725 [Cylindrobasidium torrendii FP15055 ss-10]
MERPFMSIDNNNMGTFMHGYPYDSNTRNTLGMSGLQDTMAPALYPGAHQEMHKSYFTGPNGNDGGFLQAGTVQSSEYLSPASGHNLVKGGGMDLDIDMASAGSFAQDGVFFGVPQETSNFMQPSMEPPFFNMNNNNALAGSSWQATHTTLAGLGGAIHSNNSWQHAPNNSYATTTDAGLSHEQDIQSSFASGPTAYSVGRGTPYSLPFAFNAFGASPINDNGLPPSSLTPDVQFDASSGMHGTSLNMASAQFARADIGPFVPPFLGHSTSTLPFDGFFSAAPATISAPQPVRPFIAAFDIPTPSAGTSSTPIHTSIHTGSAHYLPPYARKEEHRASNHYRADYERGQISAEYRSSYIPKDVVRATARIKIQAARAETVSASASRVAPARLTSYIPTPMTERTDAAAGDSNVAAGATTNHSSHPDAGTSTEAPTFAELQAQVNPVAPSVPAVGRSSGSANPLPVVSTIQRSSQGSSHRKPTAEYLDRHSQQKVRRYENGSALRHSVRAIPNAPKDTRAAHQAIGEKDIVDRQYTLFYAAETRAVMHPLPPRQKRNLLFDRKMIMGLRLNELENQLKEWFARFPQAKGQPGGARSYTPTAYKNEYASRALLFDVLDRWEEENGLLTCPQEGWKFRDLLGYETNMRIINTRSKEAKEARLERRRQKA